MRAKHVLATADTQCCPFLGGYSVVVDSLLVVAPIVCGSFVLGPCSVLQYLVSCPV